MLLSRTSSFCLFCRIGCCHVFCLYFNRRDKQGSSSDGNQDKSPSGNEGDDCEVRKWAIVVLNLNKSYIIIYICVSNCVFWVQFDEIDQDENVNSQNITMKDPTEVSSVSPRQSFCFYKLMFLLDIHTSINSDWANFFCVKFMSKVHMLFILYISFYVLRIKLLICLASITIKESFDLLVFVRLILAYSFLAS